MRTNWTQLMEVNENAVVDFARGEKSGRSFYSEFVNGELGGEARRLLRNRKVQYSRRLARKAARRRGVSV